jgi:cell shape-determining protein MreC
MLPNRTNIVDILRKPAVHLAGGLALAAGLLLLPTECADALKARASSLLKPGQLGVLAVREEGERIVARISGHFRTVDQLAQTRRELERVKEERRQLAARLAATEAFGQPQAKAGDSLSEPLLSARWVRARVLGQQARAFLERRHLLDVGSQSAIEADALVVDALPGLIDLGRDADLQTGQVVLSGARVWGKIIQVGPYTSTVRTVTEPGYRDLVQLAGPESDTGRIRWGPQGILEGTGERLARIRLVEVTEPVSVGDLVYSAAARGILPKPLLYGRIARVERPTGSAHWETWMEPAVADSAPETVGVLRAELSPLRVAERR